nr:MAG TPA: hypothetical protein [Caudoviricetes sp.]
MCWLESSRAGALTFLCELGGEGEDNYSRAVR